MNRLVVPLLGAALTACTTARAAPAPARGPAPQAQPSAAQPAPAGSPATPRASGGLRPWAEVTRDAVHRPGYLDTYQKDDALYLAIPRARLGRDFILSTQIAQGIGAAGLFGGTMLEIFEPAVVALERRGDRVFLLRRPMRFTAPEGSPAAAAVALSFGSSVLESARIEAIREDSTLLVNAQDWFVGDLAGIGERLRTALATGPGQPPPVPLERSRSYLESVRGFPQNVNVRARLTFRPPTPTRLPSVPDGRFVPVTVAYVLAALPEEPMRPRPADDRVGYFITARKDFARDESDFFVRHVNRWRLEPGEPVGNLVRPRRPIVYYIDPNVPVQYRPHLIAGVEAWNAAFEAAGWKDAIRAEMLPEGADPEDLRYPTLRWNTSDAPGYGAIGPSIVDPRTGEILDADILFEANMVRGFKRDWRTTLTPAAALAESFAGADDQTHAGLAAELAAQGTLLRAALAGLGELGPGEPVPDWYVGQALKWVTMHEVGHTLGLRHNFRASYDTPVDRLGDRDWAERNGLYNSVMEYPALNLPSGRQVPAYVYNPGVGSYDRWAITYGYAADDSRSAAVARQSALPGHAYGTDEDLRDAGAMDPTVNAFDLGQDPLAWARGRAQLIQGMWERLPGHVLADNARYADLTDAVNTLLVQYTRAVGIGVKYIGGQYVSRARTGDPQAGPPFAPVPRERQREALAFLAEYGFGPEAFNVPPAVLARMGPNRWSHWGQQNTHDGRIDFPFHERMAAAQAAMLNELTSPLVFARIRDAERKFGPGGALPIPELMEELSQAVWAEIWAGPRNIPSLRRDLQRAYLDRMTTLVATPPQRLPGDARAVARVRLMDLRGRVSRALTSRALDGYTRAHLTEAQARIERTLEAGLEVELGQSSAGARPAAQEP